MCSIKLLIFVVVLGAAQLTLQLQQQIQNTEQIIMLYELKLKILKQIYQKQSGGVAYEDTTSNLSQINIPIIRQFNENIILIKKLNYSSQFYSHKYIISNNHMINIDNSSIVGQFMGQLLFIQPHTLTTLIGGKVSIARIRQIDGNIEISQNLLGISGQILPSIWHRNYNIKDGQDLLIQWQNNKIIFKGKQIKIITLFNNQTIINIYSYNQYKIIFITNLRIGIINSRSTQIGQYYHIYNITKIQNQSSINIISSTKQQQFIIIILSTGQIAKYYNQKIINIQSINLSSHPYSHLSSSTISLEYIHPHLFIINRQSHTLEIYLNQIVKFQYITHIHIPLPYSHLHLYREGSSLRMFLASSNQTQIYEVLLPPSQETLPSTNYFKFIGIIMIIAIFIYFKWIKRADGNINYQGESKQLRKRLNNLPRGREQKIDLGKDKIKGIYPAQQIQQMIRRQAQGNKKNN